MYFSGEPKIIIPNNWVTREEEAQDMTKIGLLRLSYGIGAIADLIVGAAMVYPKFLALALRLEEPPLAIETRCALRIGASLMFGWTALLL